MSTNKYEDFNRFQTDFFTSINRFGSYTKYEVIKNSYQLMNNIAKQFPNLINIVINLSGIEWSAQQSPALLKALQKRFVNDFSPCRVPQFVYFQNKKVASEKTKKQKEIDSELKQQVCSILMIDSKTFEMIQDTKQVKDLMQQVLGEIENKKKSRKR